MFVRWKRTKRLRRRGNIVRETGRVALVAMLVQAERREGKPRQKVLAYLGTIDAERIGDVHPRRWFWEKCDRRLAELAVEPEQRAKIEAALQVVVARPSPDELAATQRDLAEFGITTNP